MSNTNSPPSTLNHYPRVTMMTIKKTSLLIDELEIRREDEAVFKLTPYEKKTYECLKSVFHSKKHPSEKIQGAIQDEQQLKKTRKEYLIASKLEREQHKAKEKADNDSVGALLLASGTPIILIGFMLMESFMFPAIGIIIAGISMCLPAFIRETTQKRKARKKLRNAEAQTEELSDEIDALQENIDSVCNEYQIPINCPERLNYLTSLNEAAKKYEELTRKESDYELLCQINGSAAISREIALNLQKLSGLPVNNEADYSAILKNVERQFLD